MYAKGGDGVAEKHIEAEKDYINGMKYKDIADKYGVSEATVKSWKTRYGWIREKKKITHTKNKKSMHTKKIKKEIPKKGTNTVTKAELRVVCENEELNEKQKQFCVFFIKKHNATKAYMQAYGVDYMTAAAASSRLLKNVKIRAFIEMLKNEKLNQMYFSADDLVQRYMDIAFADVGDVATFTDEGIQLRDNFDPTTVKSIKDTKYGYAIQMLDPFKAMEWLDKYFEINPQHVRRREYDQLKMQRMKQEIAAEQLRQLENEDEMNNTGVIMIAPVLEEEEEDEDYLESTTETD
jgi:phage terminase small subunit|nr:MAG TPA: Terminase small subunit [Caudoviricetes sp.]